MSNLLNFGPGGRQKSSNFFKKEKLRFLTYSQTFQEAKPAVLRFEHHKVVHHMPYVNSSDSTSTTLHLSVDQKSDSPSFAFCQTPDDITPTSSVPFERKELNRYSGFHAESAKNNSIRVFTSESESQSKKSDFQSQVKVIMNHCARLNRDVGRFEKKLVRTESRLFDSMTNLLKKTGQRPRFTMWSEDKNFLKKKDQLQKDLSEEQEAKNQRAQTSLRQRPSLKNNLEAKSLTVDSNKTNDTQLGSALPAVCSIIDSIEEDRVGEMNESSSKDKIRILDNSHIYEENRRNLLNSCTKLMRVQANSSSPQHLRGTANGSGDISIVKSNSNQKPKRIDELTEEAIWNQIEEIPRWSGSKKMFERGLSRKTLNIQTYAVQEEDFLKGYKGDIKISSGSTADSESPAKKKKTQILKFVLKKIGKNEKSSPSHKNPQVDMSTGSAQSETKRLVLKRANLSCKDLACIPLRDIEIANRNTNSCRPALSVAKTTAAIPNSISELVSTIHTINNSLTPIRRREVSPNLRDRIAAIRSPTLVYGKRENDYFSFSNIKKVNYNVL